MKIGAEPKKTAILAGLLVVAGYLMYANIFGGTEATIPANARKSVARPAEMPELAQPPAETARKGTSRRISANVQEWVPRVGGRQQDKRPDPATVDPALRLDLLARLQSVTLESGERSLFEFSTAPVKLPPDTIINPKKKPDSKGTEEAKLPEIKPTEGIKPIDTKPPAPAIPLKFYGHVAARDGRRAFFLSGDEIFIAGEGQIVQSRYKIVRIGLNSATIEDTQHSNTQTIPLVEEPAGS